MEGGLKNTDGGVEVMTNTDIAKRVQNTLSIRRPEELMLVIHHHLFAKYIIVIQTIIMIQYL